MTSRDLVNRVQRRLRREMNDRKLKVGHTGTLDPLADGLVVIAVGAAARLTPWMLQHTKRYVARYELGVSSISGDLEESVTRLAEAPVVSAAEVDRATNSLLGWIDQIPPAHSAIWVDGERAHQRTRRGEQVEMPTRRVWIDSIKVLHYEYPHLDVDVRCGSGTYLRTLGMDLAARCQSVAVMTSLTRTEVGPFDIESAIAELPPSTPPPDRSRPLWEGLSPIEGVGNLGSHLQPPLTGLRHLPRLSLSVEDAVRVRNGLAITGDPQPPSVADLATIGPRAHSAKKPYEEHGQTHPPTTECVAIDAQGELAAVLRQKQAHWAPFRVFVKSHPPRC